MKNNIGFSLWLDFIERDFLKSGKFKELINKGFIDGATSNPAIFADAILNSKAYQNDILKLKNRNLTPKEIYENLAMEDIKLSAQELLPLYKQNKRGFVSIEIDPFLANNVEKSVEEGIRLYRTINFPNVMIKVPATESGYKVMEKLISLDINVNATLIFSTKEAICSAEAIKKGQLKNGKAQAVLSIFVSRLDKAISSQTFGIVNSSEIYKEIVNRNYSKITPLFASTGVKDPSLPEWYYIQKLLAKNSINTAPLKTILAFEKENFPIQSNLPLSPNFIRERLLTISETHTTETVLHNLKQEGLLAFEKSFQKILDYLKDYKEN